MKSLAVRLTLLSLFVVATGVSAYLFWMGESRAQTDVPAVRAFDAAAVAAERDALELRAGQQAYVAAGQGDDFWTAKVAAATTALRERLTRLRTDAISVSAQSSIDNASSALEDFAQMDGRAREFVKNAQKGLASDLIFSDGLASTGAIVSSIDQARSFETQTSDAAAAASHTLQLLAAAAAAGVGLLVILLLVPRPALRREQRSQVPSIIASTPGSLDSAAGLDIGAALNRDWTPRSAGSESTPASAIDLAAVAALCSDLARVAQTQALPAILERAAAVLDAPGIVLWIADPDGRELAPILTHGYPQQIVSRLGTILAGAENATGAAFRTSLLQTVNRDSISNGAIAAPLVTPSGCVGVMAAEVRNDGEKDAGKLAAATIVAAQLATLVGPPSARAQAKLEATGA
ncbi:MAG: GAF domain-containing protein [Acidobacteriota bacterium]